MTIRPGLRSLLACTLTLLTACGSDESDEKGAPPQIVDVKLDKSEIKVGVIETITMTISYSDAEGDVASVSQQLVAPSGTSQAPTSLALAQAAGQKEGSQALALQVAAPAAGTASVIIWLVDSKGNESTKVTRTITAK